MQTLYKKAAGIIAAVILCQTGSFAAEGPPLRTGLWVTEKTSEAAANVSGFESSIRGNPSLSGVCLTASWNEVEKESGHLNLSAVDAAVAAMHRVGMKYEIALKPGVDTPAYVFQEGAKAFETRVSNPHRPNFGGEVRIPIPWDPVYQRNFSRVLGEFGKRYASDPQCVGVVLTCANFMSKEMHLPKAPTDRANWQATGDYGSKLLEVYKKYIDEWGGAFPRQALSLHLAKVADLPPSFNERVIDYGISKYPERFTIQNCQLTGRREDVGTMSYDLVLKYGSRAHHGFQSLAALSRGGERMGSVQMAVLNVVHGGGEYWELWHGDGMSAQTSGEVLKAWDEAKRLGYEEYKKKLIATGQYQEQSGGRHRGGGRGGRRNAAPEPETEL